VLACVAWCGSISLSRLYVGVHSVADLLGGLLLGGLVLLVGLAVGEPVDAFLSTSYFGPLVGVAVCMALVYAYPAPAAWTNAYGDTALIIAVEAGICCGQSAFLTIYPAVTFAQHGEPQRGRLPTPSASGHDHHHTSTTHRMQSDIRAHAVPRRATSAARCLRSASVGAR